MNSAGVSESTSRLEVHFFDDIEDVVARPGDVFLSRYLFERGVTVSEMDWQDTRWASAYVPQLFCLACLCEAVVTAERILVAPCKTQEPLKYELTEWIDEADLVAAARLEFEEDVMVLGPDSRTIYREFLDNTISRVKGLANQGRDLTEQLLLFLGYNDLLRISFASFLQVAQRGIPFMADCLSSGVIAHSVARTYAPPKVATRIALDLIEGRRADAALAANERRAAAVFDMYMPAIFAAVLKNSSSPNDVLKVATQMRDTKGAKSLRTWGREVDGTPILKEFNARIEEVQALADELAGGIGAEPGEIQFGLGVLGFGVSLTDKIPKPIAKASARLARLVKRARKPHLSFLTSLYDECMSIASLGPEIERVFGINGKAVVAAMEEAGEVLSGRG